MVVDGAVQDVGDVGDAVKGTRKDLQPVKHCWVARVSPSRQGHNEVNWWKGSAELIRLEKRVGAENTHQQGNQE